MRNPTCEHVARFGAPCRWRRRRRGGATIVGALALCAACDRSADDHSRLTAEGRVWQASFYENFAVTLSASEANCMAAEVQELTRLVGPLVGQRPDDTPGSAWAAIDHCLDRESQGEVARAIVYGGWSAEEPALSEVWGSADELLGGCISAAGGWEALGSYAALIATCAGTEVQR